MSNLRFATQVKRNPLGFFLMFKVSPIPTHYNGYYFRSRLEARWAVFFDTLNIRWEYELEGFQIDENERYLPDFYLPDFKSWIEIKPEIQTENITSSEMWRKAKKLVDGLIGNVEGNTETESFYIAFGTPGVARFLQDNDTWKLRSGSVLIPVRKSINTFDLKTFAMVDGGSSLDIFPIYVSKVGVSKFGDVFISPVLPSGFMQRIYTGRGVFYETDNLKSAYTASRSARFEFGENGEA